MSNNFNMLPAAICLGLLSSFPAQASEISHHAIPASMCTPVQNSIGKLDYDSQGWRFVFDQYGGATLYCPLPLSVQPSAGQTDIVDYNIYHRDYDGTGSDSRISTYFYELDENGAMYWSGYWSSNYVAGTQYKRSPQYLGKNFSWYRLNGFYVYLYRSATTVNSPIFGGIDFAVNLI